MTDTLEAPAIGHNQGPELSPFDAHRVNIEDLYAEAKGWLDGEPIANAKQAESVEALLDMVREAKKAADEARRVENIPFDTGKAEVQARYNPVLKKADTAADACKAALQPWRAAQDAEHKRLAHEARLAAEAKAKAAADAMRKVDAANLADVERAETLMAVAERAQRVAAKAAKPVATGLRTFYVPTLINGVEAARHYWQTQREACEAFFLGLAQTDCRAGKRQIPGFEVTEEKRAV